MHFLRLILLSVILSTMNGCLFFSTYKSAKMLDRGSFEVGGMVSTQRDISTDEPDTYNQFGIHGGIGISKKFNLHARAYWMRQKDELYHEDTYEYSEGDGVYWDNYFDIEPKWSLRDDQLIAISCPVGIHVQEPTLAITPTFIVSPKIFEHSTFNLAVKTPIYIEGGLTFATTAGLSIYTKGPIVIIPEFGFLLDKQEGNMISLGIAANFQKTK